MNKNNNLNFDDDESITDNQYLTFNLGKESYAVNLDNVIEIIQLVEIVKIPTSNPSIKGIINIRNKIYQVMDLRVKLNLDQIEYNSRTCIIILSQNNKEIGLIVDSVAEVSSISEDKIESLKTKVENNYFKDVGRVNDSVKIILDIEGILD